MFPCCVSILCFFFHVFYCLSISLTCKLALSTDQPTLTTWGLVSVSGMVTGSFSRTLTSKQTCGKNMLAVNAGKIGIHLRVILEYRATYLHTSERFLEQDIQNKSGSVFYSFAHTSHVRSFSPTQPPPPPPLPHCKNAFGGGGGGYRSMIKSCNKISVLPCQI